MELIETWDKKRMYGNMATMGLFHCPYCDQLVVKRLFDGKRTKSCGCMIIEFNTVAGLKHGGHKDPVYHIWETMKQRCYNTNNPRYKRYGARGIIICNEWLNDFAVFQKWSYENGYKRGLQIDRINNDLNYSPDNCRFVIPIINARNKSNIKITVEIAQNIIRDYASGEYTHRTLAIKYNIVHSYVGRILRGLNCVPITGSEVI